MIGVVLCGIGSAVAAAVRWVRSQPMGYEDEQGFHFGAPTPGEFAVIPEGFRVAPVQLPKLTDAQRVVLLHMSEELGIPLRDLRETTGLSANEISTARFDLRIAGLATFGPLVHEDTGLLAGRGYTLTREGARVQKHLRDAERRAAEAGAPAPVDPDPRIASHMAMGLDRMQAARNVEALDRAIARGGTRYGDFSNA